MVASGVSGRHTVLSLREAGRRQLFVCLAPVAYHEDMNQWGLVVDPVDDAVVAHPNPP